jgi:hypothetical protein
VQLGRPDLDGDRLVYHRAGRAGTRIVEVDLRTRRRRTLFRSRSAQLLNPSLLAGALLYVEVSPCGQRLILSRRRHARVLLRGRALTGADAGFEPGHTSQGSGYGPCPGRRHTSTMLWTTALSERFAYLTTIRPEPGGAGRSSIVRVAR